MAALTAQAYPDSRNLGAKRTYPAAADVCYAGGVCMINAAGFAQPAVAEAGNAGCVGIFVKTVDNSAGSAGDLTVEVQEGDYQLAAVSIAQTSLNLAMYGLDDATFDETQLTNQPVLGKLLEYESATLGWVRISLETSS